MNATTKLFSRSALVSLLATLVLGACATDTDLVPLVDPDTQTTIGYHDTESHEHVFESGLVVPDDQIARREQGEVGAARESLNSSPPPTVQTSTQGGGGSGGSCASSCWSMSEAGLSCRGCCYIVASPCVMQCWEVCTDRQYSSTR